MFLYMYICVRIVLKYFKRNDFKRTACFLPTFVLFEDFVNIHVVVIRSYF